MNHVSTMAKPFDMSLVQRGARLRRSPFFEATQRYGPKGFTVYNHTLFPTNFDDFEAEYSHLLEPRDPVGRRRRAQRGGNRARTASASRNSSPAATSAPARSARPSTC